MKNKFGSILLKQIIAARQLLGFKSRKQLKKPKSFKQKYVPGTIGLSQVSTEIKKDHGAVLNRRSRKKLAKMFDKPFQAYYN